MPVEVLMPALSPTMTEGNLVRWLKKEGDSVGAGDVIAEIETDKATMEVESVDEGTLGRILVAEGTEAVPVNKLIAVILEEGEEASELDAFGGDASNDTGAVKSAPETSSAEKKIAEKPSAKAAPSAASSAAQPKGQGGRDRLFVSPVARRLAESKGVDLQALEGSGPRGRIVKVDVEQASSSGGASALTNAAATTRALAYGVEGDVAPMRVEISSMRKVIAQRLTESKQQVPHFYLTVECELDALLSSRKDLNTLLEAEGAKISVNDFVIRAVALALHQVPEANVSWGGDHVLQYQTSDVSVAVSIEGGLITPIIAQAERKGLRQISTEMKELASRARSGGLKPEEFQGGSFSISNLGMFGIKQFDAVINTPQACILAVGAGEKRAVVRGDGSLQAATVMTCTLSVDHRAVDGAVGAKFLKSFKAFIEKPSLMLM
ncbi:MAG: pyruvate dehydrogenase complex dihydrolipoamide acetyltransferase [bacterium]|nr:pyruvate dehydrogenase complex dihydrolipoamide acetyltransferase [bacterium]